MKLPTTVRKKALTISPRLLLLFGAPKVGKTKLLSDGVGNKAVLIIDTERGTDDKKNVLSVCVNNMKDLIEVYKALKEEHDAGNTREFVALDTIDNVVDWIDAGICKQFGVDSVGDIPHGKGWGLRKDKLMDVIKRFKSVVNHLIIVGHEKRTTIGTDDNLEVDVMSINLSGQLKIKVASDADAIGKVMRNDENELVISFEGKEGQVEAGSRCEHLAGNIIKGDLSNVYIDA